MASQRERHPYEAHGLVFAAIFKQSCHSPCSNKTHVHTEERMNVVANMYTSTRMHLHICTHLRPCKFIAAHTHIYIYILHVNILTRICTHIRIHIHILHTHINLHTSPNTCVPSPRGASTARSAPRSFARAAGARRPRHCVAAAEARPSLRVAPRTGAQKYTMCQAYSIWCIVYGIRT